MAAPAACSGWRGPHGWPRPRRDERILFLVVEPCGLTFCRNDRSKSNIVATALFGDGAAAAVVSCTGEGPALTATGEHTWSDTLDVMGWGVEDEGLRVIFSRDIPSLIRERFRPVLDDFLARHALGLGDIDHWLCHPGGAKVLDALEDVLDCQRGTLGHSRAVLRDYGNMSAVTVMFVLARALGNGGIGRRSLMSALGPGFTVGFLMLENGASGQRKRREVSLCHWIVTLVARPAPGRGRLGPAQRDGGCGPRAASRSEPGTIRCSSCCTAAGLRRCGRWRRRMPLSSGRLLALFVLLQAGRLWVIASLGRFWTTRIITVPGAPLIRRGPYRWLKHPNYLVVAGEIAVLPLAFGLWQVAVVFSVLNALLLWHRIRWENRALAPRRFTASPTG